MSYSFKRKNSERNPTKSKMIGFALTDIKTCVNDWVIDKRKKKEIDITHEGAEQ